MTSLSASKPTKEVFMTITQKCLFEGCDNAPKNKNLCRGHYQQQTAGQPLRMLQTSKDYKKRIDQPEYKIWVNIRYRCLNENSKPYKHYGGRGIKICERWDDFDLFIEDMGKRPSKNHSVDRIDVNGDYSPENCRWADWTTQNRNSRVQTGSSSGVKGVFWDKSINLWTARIKTEDKRIHLRSSKDKNEAILERLKGEYKYWGYICSDNEYLVNDSNRSFIYGQS